VAEQIGEALAQLRGFFAVSDTGTLVYQSGEQAGQTLTWLDRTGKRLVTVGESGELFRTSLSPDGKRAAVSVYDRAARNYDLWISDLVRNLRSRFTFDPANENEGIWSPDGSQIVFSSDRKGHLDLYRKLASGAGTEELLYADGLDKRVTSWSPDGKFVIYDSFGDPKTGDDLWVLPLEGERKPFPS
jgi:Tol biopolymer transport system component